jgi:predicted LPLAT superfamily acyltransferase
MKVNILWIDTMRHSFGFSQSIKDQPATFLDRARQRAVGKDLSNAGEGQRPLKPLLNDDVDLYRRERATMYLALLQAVAAELEAFEAVN